MTNYEPKHPPADMAGLDDLIWRIKERMPIDHTEMLALAARVKVLEAENERLRGALQPFAKAGEIAGEPSPYGDWYAYRPAAGDDYAIFGQHLRDATAALKGTEQ